MTSKSKRRGRHVSTAARPAYIAARPTLTRNGISANLLVELADERIAEATLLFRHKHYSGSAYIIGYAVELLLKAIIARNLLAGNWPLVQIVGDFKTHDLELLLEKAGLENRMRIASRNNLQLGINWSIIREWRTTIRYLRLSQHEARDMVEAVTNSPNGVAEWLSVWAR